MVESASKQPSTGVLATVIGVFTLLLGSTSVFAQLQDSLNRIWHVEPIPGAGFRSLVRQRVLSFAMVLVIAFLLLISLLLSAALVAIGKYLEGNLPGGNVLWQAMNAVVSYFITAFLFGAIYKVLPDVQLQWRDVRVGALITAAFFTIGKFLIGFYLGKSSIASAYGLAGSIVIFLTWAYYSSAVLLLGAEFTYHYREVKGESQPDLIIG